MPASRFPVYLLLIVLFLSALGGCRHEPFMLAEDDDITMIDTTEVDTMPTDTMITDTSAVDCDTTKINFQREVLPILRSNCALSGCHDANSARDGVVLTSYESTVRTADVRPFDLSGSDLYEVLVDDDEDDRMPPAPRSRLPASQINLIAAWILEGAEDIQCEDSGQSCQTEGVRYSTTVRPIIETHCRGCHSGPSPSGGIDLSSHAGVRARAESGQLLGSIDWRSGYSPMPQGGEKLPACQIEQIAAWIADGAPNN